MRSFVTPNSLLFWIIVGSKTLNVPLLCQGSDSFPSPRIRHSGSPPSGPSSKYSQPTRSVPQVEHFAILILPPPQPNVPSQIPAKFPLSFIGALQTGHSSSAETIPGVSSSI